MGWPVVARVERVSGWWSLSADRRIVAFEGESTICEFDLGEGGLFLD